MRKKEDMQNEEMIQEETQEETTEETIQEVTQGKATEEIVQEETQEESTETATKETDKKVAQEQAGGTSETAETETKQVDETVDKRFFKKKNKKDKKDEMIQELTDKVTRQMAEFDNFRKRSEKEKASRYEMGAKDIIERILPVIDNFERGLQGVAPEQKDDPFVEGMDKIYKQFMTSLEEIGVKPIEAVGQPFDQRCIMQLCTKSLTSMKKTQSVKNFKKGIHIEIA